MKLALYFCLLLLFIAIFILSLLSSEVVTGLYGAVSQWLHFDLKAHHIRVEQINDPGHFVAGFVLAGLSLLIVRRWWMIPLCLLFLVGIELAQMLTVDRQPSLMDVVRGWAGVATGWSAWMLVNRLGWLKKSALSS